MMSPETPRQTVQRFVDALVDGDGDALAAVFAEDATWTVGGEIFAGTHRGRDAILNDFLGPATALFEPGSFKVEVENVLVDGDMADVEWRIQARSARGAEYDNRYNMMFELRDGSITAVREYLDTAYAKRVLMPDAE